MSTALRSVGLLDVLSSTPAATSGRAPCIHARLRRLARNLVRKMRAGVGCTRICRDEKQPTIHHVLHPRKVRVW